MKIYGDKSEYNDINTNVLQPQICQVSMSKQYIAQIQLDTEAYNLDIQTN